MGMIDIVICFLIVSVSFCSLLIGKVGGIP